MTIPFGLAAPRCSWAGSATTSSARCATSLLLPWIFLTIAIVLGGWWAYEVLGWGGYWAWDPVENASFLPWLTATAALHSALLVERKGILKGWTVTLVLATFLLTILGTFMTRSGVFNSVHSFTQSAIGPTILVFLAAALLVFTVDPARAARGHAWPPKAASRLASAATRCSSCRTCCSSSSPSRCSSGTVFPLVVEALNDQQMSVGRPYFDRMAVPLGAALLFLHGRRPCVAVGARHPGPGQGRSRAAAPRRGGACSWPASRSG